MRKLFFFIFTGFLFADITGAVVDSQGLPLDSVKVSMESEGLEVFSDSEGKFLLEIEEEKTVNSQDLSFDLALQLAQKIEVFSLRGSRIFVSGAGDSFLQEFKKQNLGMYIIRLKMKNEVLILKGHNQGATLQKVSQRLMKEYLNPVNVLFSKKGFVEKLVQVSNSEITLGTVELIETETSISSIESSSSIVLSKWCEVEGNCGVFTDERDLQEYRWTKINGKVWMAENLNFDAGKESYCYNDSLPMCEKYGRLYTWWKFMDGKKASNEIPSGIRGLCPEGWYLPSDPEWEELALFISDETGVVETSFGDWIGLGDYLKKEDEWGAFPGEDSYGFAALPGGNLHWWQYYEDNGKWARWLTASENSNQIGFIRGVGAAVLDRDTEEKVAAFSARCIRDDFNSVPEDTVVKYEHVLDTGSFVDVRDGQVYKHTRIGEQIWMAQNLNFKYGDTSQSWCHENSQENCDLYGRYYTWYAAMDSSSSSWQNPSGVQGICPAGWHLPSSPEWDVLDKYVGVLLYYETNRGSGYHLKSGEMWKWGSWGSDVFGFNGLPTGQYVTDATTMFLEYASWWSASDALWGEATYWYTEYIYDSFDDSQAPKTRGLPVRCLKDEL